MPRKTKKNPEDSDIDPKRAKRSKTALTKRDNKRIKKELIQLKLEGDVKSFIETKAKESGKEPLEVVDEFFKHGFAVIEFDETVGKASLVYQAFSSNLVPEIQKLSPKIIADFRNLRDNFAPVAAGVEWHRDFTSGGGFVIRVDDSKDKHKQKMRESIKDLCKKVYQDQYTVGLDNILDIMMDTALTDGCAAAEILYEKEVEFIDYVEGIETIKDTTTGKPLKIPIMKEMEEEDWKELGKISNVERGGVTRLKIIEDAYNRLRPYRHPISGEVLYWTLDEKIKEDKFTYDPYQKKKIIKFHPWEILWLSWNQRGTNLKGMSIIQPVYSIAKFVQAIIKAIGIGFARWANKKYFFICGTEKRPWSKPHNDQFLKAMEKMIKDNMVGIPVPAGFDIKNIGGEQSVFEGKDLLDYLTGMICAGMQFPREFLEVGRTQASDKAWLAWTVRYGRSQQQVRRAIEHQLFKVHLWCNFGFTHRIPKKGVKISEQEKRPIYIPKIEWRAEGRWHREEKTKQLKSILDAANPADPPLKLAIERELSTVMGLGELDFDIYIELFNIQTEIKLITAKNEKLVAQAKLEIDEKLQKEGKLEEAIEARRLAVTEKAKEKEQPTQQPTQEELQRRGEERLKKGVSRTGREQPTEKGRAKPVGLSRQPRMQETIPTPITLLPRDLAEKLTDEMVKTEKAKQKRNDAEADKFTTQTEAAKRKLILTKELQTKYDKAKQKRKVSKR